MLFRLTYAGPLLGSSNGNSRASHKHDIRKVFHRQLRALWETHVQLKNHVGQGENLHGSPAYLATQFAQNGYKFVPLVYEAGYVYSRIEILMLRRGNKQSIVQNGDIDGRLKTLFDALRMPSSLDELAGHQPANDEDPFYCLLEDDNLVTKASIESDYLLEPVEECDSQNQVRLFITVEVKQSLLRGGGYGSL